MTHPDQSRPGSKAGGTGVPARSALDWPVAAGTVEALLLELDARASQRRRRRLAAAGCVAAVLVAGVLWQTPRAPESDAPAASTVVVSVPSRQVLPDGSVVESGEGSELAVDFSATPRRVTLRRGVAHFEVAKNAGRPFIVDAGGVAVRAVGTAFSVQMGPQAVEVLVTEGRVAVDRAASRPSVFAARPASRTLAVVDAGNRVVVDVATLSAELSALQVQPVTAAELEEKLAWRVPRLEFSNTPLAEAVPMFNRYSRVRLILADSALGGLQFSGIVRADNVEALLRLLEANFGIKAEQRAGNELVLRKAR